MKVRDSTIDISKGLVIILVVLGHALETLVLRGSSENIAAAGYHSIYLFHMPFWFLLSGWLFKGAQAPGLYFRKKFGHLMVPYFSWLLVFNLHVLAGFFGNVVRGSMNDEKWAFYLGKLGEQLYGGNAVHGSQMILWFPTCLFFTQQVANLLFYRVGRRGMLVAIGLISLGLAMINQFWFPDFHLPLALNVVAGALPFFLLGVCFGDYMDTKWVKRGASLCFLAAVIMIGVWQVDAYFHMRMAWYGFPLISMASAVGGFVMMLSVTKQISRLKMISGPLVTVGAASMTIMYIHVVVLVKVHEIGVTSFLLRTVLAVMIPLGVHLLLSKSRMISILLLGK